MRRARSAVWFGICMLALLAGVVAAVANLWLPAALSAGVAVVTGTLAGLWTTRGANALQARDDQDRAAARLIRPGSRNRLPRVRERDDPVLLGVHPAAPADESGARRRTPPFILRDITPELTDLITRDRFVLVVGESTAGKSRVLYEAMRALLPEHWLVEPNSRQAVEVAVDTVTARRRSVLWLDDLERFLGTDGLTGAAVEAVLSASGGDRFILATMRAEEHAKYSARGGPGVEEPRREALRSGWDVLRLATHVHLPRTWSSQELERAAEHRSDHRIREALEHGDQFGLAEYMAAGPQLLADWRDAWAPGTHPRAAALVLAAVDARRAGIHRPLDLATLTVLHEPYLQDRGGARLRPEPLDSALAWATTPLHATSSLLIPDAAANYLAFDYLIDAIEKSPIPNHALDTLISIATADEAVEVGYFAWRLLRLDQAENAFRRAELKGNTTATSSRCDLVRDRNGQAASVQLTKEIAESRARRLGPDHPDVLHAQLSYGWELGMTGDTATALEHMKQLLPKAARVHGEHDRKTLHIRDGIANWTAHAGDPAAAAAMYTDLIGNYTDMLGNTDPTIFQWRDAHAEWTAEAGDVAEALRLRTNLVEDMESARLPRHDILGARYRLAYFTTRAGQFEEAQRLWRRVIAESHALHGALHSTTLSAREDLADCIGQSGDASTAVIQINNVLDDLQKLGGPRTRDVVMCRGRLAHWTGEGGDPTSAVRELRQVLLLSTELLGADDMTTLTIRSRLARWTGETGDVTNAISILERLVNDLDIRPIPNTTLRDKCRTDLEGWRRHS